MSPIRAAVPNLVPGRSGKAYRDWLDERGDESRKRVDTRTLDPFQGYKNATDDALRRIEQGSLGHRGRKRDPLNGIRHIVRAGQERLTTRKQIHVETAFAAYPDHVSVEVANMCA